MEDLRVSGSANGIENLTNLTCYSLDTAPIYALAVHATVLAVIILTSMIGNGLVLVLVIAYKQLKTRSVIISMSMVIADVLYTLFNTLPSFVTTVNKGWAFGQDGCIAFGIPASVLLMVRWFVVGVLCIDRFCTIRFPFSYNKRKRKNFLNILFISIAWVVPVVVSVIPIYTFSDFQLRENIPTCLPTCVPGNLTCRIYYTILFTITYIIGSIVPVTTYCYLFNKARTLKKSTRHKIGHHTIRIASGLLVTQSIGEYPKLTRENQATVTFVLIFVTVVVTGTPGYLLQLIRTISVELHCAIPIIVHFIVIEVFLSAPMLTPLVIMRDRNFRACLIKLFCCRKKTGDLNLEIPTSQERRGSIIINQRSFGSRRSSIVASQELSKKTKTTNNSILSEPAVYTITESRESESSHKKMKTTNNPIISEPAVYTITESCESESCATAPPPTPS